MSSSTSVSNGDSHEFAFGQFRIRGATHIETSLTIHANGKWSSTSRIKTTQTPFKPMISLSVEFFQRSTGMQVPVGTTSNDWSPKELWSMCFGKSEEKEIVKHGESDFIRHHFQVLSGDAEGKLKMRLQRNRGWLSRLF